MNKIEISRKTNYVLSRTYLLHVCPSKIFTDANCINRQLNWQLLGSKYNFCRLNGMNQTEMSYLWVVRSTIVDGVSMQSLQVPGKYFS